MGRILPLLGEQRSRSETNLMSVDSFYTIPTSITFDLVEGILTLIIGLDVRAYCDTYNLQIRSTFE